MTHMIQGTSAPAAASTANLASLHHLLLLHLLLLLLLLLLQHMLLLLLLLKHLLLLLLLLPLSYHSPCLHHLYPAWGSSSAVARLLLGLCSLVTLYTVHSTLLNRAHYTLDILHCTIHSGQYTICSTQCTAFSTNSILCILYIVHAKWSFFYILQWTVHSRYCTDSAKWTMYRLQ